MRRKSLIAEDRYDEKELSSSVKTFGFATFSAGEGGKYYMRGSQAKTQMHLCVTGNTKAMPKKEKTTRVWFFFYKQQTYKTTNFG